MVHMVMLSTEHSFLPGSAQYQWLANDLQNVDRKKTPLLLLVGIVLCTAAIELMVKAFMIVMIL